MKDTHIPQSKGSEYNPKKKAMLLFSRKQKI